jgi:hypothetical protein
VKVLILLISVIGSMFVFSSAAIAQNRFEGYNVVLSVPEDQTSFACALRYVPPMTEVKVTDLDTRTPMKLTGCGGPGSSVAQTSATTATIRASSADYRWCFQGEDKRYRISFQGDRWNRTCNATTGSQTRMTARAEFITSGFWRGRRWND